MTDTYKLLLSQLEEREVMPGFFGRFIHTGQSTIAFWRVVNGSQLKVHSHMHEQTTLVLNGTFELNVDGNISTYNRESACVIPGNTFHSGRALTDCELIDIFVPEREDLK